MYEPTEDKRRELIARFEQAATILRTDERVRRSPAAKVVLQDELLAAFLEGPGGRDHAVANARSIARRRAGPPR